MERWLYRLSRSEHAERFVLKGALLLRVWDVAVGRPTRDIDLLARTSNDLDSVRTAVKAICGTSVEDDGMAFDGDSVTTERISEDADYEGVRATFSGSLATARCPMQIDMGFGDSLTPAPQQIDYPSVIFAYAIYTRQSRVRNDITLSSCDVQFQICRDYAEAVFPPAIPWWRAVAEARARVT